MAKLLTQLLISNCFISYLARNEICRRIKGTQNVNPTSNTSDFKFTRITIATQQPDLPQVDLLIRTSGEARLTDFLLYETQNSHLYFSEKLWPDFCVLELVKTLAYYNYYGRHVVNRFKIFLFGLKNRSDADAQESL